jgi:hypothetical protein
LPLLLAGLATRPVAAGDPPGRVTNGEERLDGERHQAIRRACAWIGSHQNDGGSFGEGKAVIAFTALSTLALMASGSGVGRGPHGGAVRKAIGYLVDRVSKGSKTAPRGYVTAPGDINSRMHGHGYAMLALATALASADEELAARVRPALEAAVACAENSQTMSGGWGYEPTRSQEHEGSVTVTVAQGLRAAHDAGIRVSHDVVARGLGYLRQSQKPDGSFKYSLQQDRSTYALTAAAISSFYLLGEYGKDPGDKDRLEGGIRYLKRSLVQQMQRREWFYYGHFYAAWAAWQKDGNDPIDDVGTGAEDLDRSDRFWGPWHARVYRTFLDTQREDGSWHDEEDRFSFGDLLPTAFAVLTLAIPDEALPIFQR